MYRALSTLVLSIIIVASIILGAQECAAKPVECQSVADNFIQLQTAQGLTNQRVEQLGVGAIGLCLNDDNHAECVLFIQEIPEAVKFFDGEVAAGRLKEGGKCKTQNTPGHYYFLSVERPKA